jgi:hypothetical protein
VVPGNIPRWGCALQSGAQPGWAGAPLSVPPLARQLGTLASTATWFLVSERCWFMSKVLQIGIISSAALPADGQIAPNTRGVVRGRGVGSARRTA